jgi:hypothetical protein
MTKQKTEKSIGKKGIFPVTLTLFSMLHRFFNPAEKELFTKRQRDKKKGGKKHKHDTAAVDDNDDGV